MVEGGSGNMEVIERDEERITRRESTVVEMWVWEGEGRREGGEVCLKVWEIVVDIIFCLFVGGLWEETLFWGVYYAGKKIEKKKK